MIIFIRVVIAISLLLYGSGTSFAATFKKLDRPPLSERWFGIHVDGERVGFYRQTISETPEGYRMDGYGSVRMRVMGFSKEASTRESYLVAKNLSLRSFDVEQIINGTPSRITGRYIR